MYITFMIEENKNLYVSRWLLIITCLVALIIVVGGLTRLTDSGLSITEWNLISGIFPPMSLNEWEEAFLLYKKIPEFILLNSSMTLDEFKIIFWWEYIHRLLGRVIGLFYLVPLLIFTFTNFLERKKLKSLYLILFLIIVQGFVGWYMVQSGLVDRVDVSHYRLCLHLTIAFIIFILLVWNYLKYTKLNTSTYHKKIPYNLPILFLICLMCQISIGALVSGLDAGQIYQSWPLMNQTYFPDDSNISDLFTLKVLEIPSLVQFIHRNMAYFIILLFTLIFLIVYKNDDFYYLKNTVFFIFLFMLFQIFLGILTIISGAQLIYASMHQIGSIFVVSSFLYIAYKNTKLTYSF